MCKEREHINSDTEAEKKRKKLLPNVEDRTLAVRLPIATAPVTLFNAWIVYIAPT